MPYFSYLFVYTLLTCFLVVQSVEFDIDKEYVGRVVGAQGSGINKLRDQLGVQVDVSDEVEEKEKEFSGKKKKAVHLKAKVKVCHRLFVVSSVKPLSELCLLDHWPEGKRRRGQKADPCSDREAGTCAFSCPSTPCSTFGWHLG